MIPFSPPRIDQRVVDEVTAALLSGWITTGPRTKLFEKKITEYCGCQTTVAVNSWTAGMEILLRWWGVGPGDEVIIPVYTYCASANVVLHTGATPVMVDISPDDFNISNEKMRKINYNLCRKWKLLPSLFDHFFKLIIYSIQKCIINLL